MTSSSSSTAKRSTRGARDATSRYARLAQELDADPSNGVFEELDTRRSVRPASGMFFADLFSGAGGMSRGMSDAGFEKLFSVEIDPDGSATIRRNFPGSHHFEGPIESVTEAEMEAAVGDRPLHMVCGGPPCQGFSVAGLRDPVDPRNQLFREYIRAIRHLQPDMIVMENVPGILTMDDGAVVREIRDQLAEAGYPNATVRILEAARFGVPQLRTRAIFVANRHGLKNPYPAPILSREDYVPIEAAIDDLKALPMDPAFNHNGTRHGKPMIERLSRLAPGASLYPTFRDAWKRQYKGVPSMAIKENHGGVHVHYELNRVLTAREMARLQTFPDDFFFEGRFKRVYWQIGNAVPCLFAEHLGRAVAMALQSEGITRA